MMITTQQMNFYLFLRILAFSPYSDLLLVGVFVDSCLMAERKEKKIVKFGCLEGSAADFEELQRAVLIEQRIKK
jgi:hypothetical protein